VDIRARLWPSAARRKGWRGAAGDAVATMEGARAAAPRHGGSAWRGGARVAASGASTPQTHPHGPIDERPRRYHLYHDYVHRESAKLA
jgi:hypothetical protein